MEKFESKIPPPTIPLHGKIGPVSHGLNLVLPLKSPLQMPFLLWEIEQRLPQISQALKELGFVHFARFLPTRDGSALQVITEFDGPLKPYVMDFAAVVGDLFTVILSFVRDAPPRPVADHPEEFWEFVKRHNQVTVFGVPLPGEFPLFSAYPGTTVLEIQGPRLQLPPPVVDKPSATVDLADVQGNILSGYRASLARHFVYAVTDAVRARAWISSLADGCSDAALSITTSSRWDTKPSTMLNLGLTCAGLAALGIKASLLADFPQAFREGPANEIRAQANGDTGPCAPERWRLGAPGTEAHIMLSLYAFADQESAFEAASTRIDGIPLADNGVRLIYQQDAMALPDQRGHFGYREGMGEPRIAIFPSSSDEDKQPAASPGEFLLGENYFDIFGGHSIGKLAPALASNGTFCAVRLLAQDVEAFQRVLDDGRAMTNASRELVAAKLMGRWFDGEPLALYANEEELEKAPETAKDTNAFDYAPSYEYPATPSDHDGLRCPIGAHIRRANPRTSRTVGLRYSRRLLRRGMPYKIPASDQAPAEVGLFALFFCGSLERQFEFIQQQWINGDLFTAGLRGTQDPMAGTQAASSPFLIPGLGEEGGTARLEVPRLITTRGSLYLFFPGLKALRNLGNPALLEVSAPWIVSTFDAELTNLQQIVAEALRPDVVDPLVLDAAVAVPEPARARKANKPNALEPGGAFNPTDLAFLANPYPTFAQFRKLCPVRHVPEHDAFWVFPYALVKELLTDNTRFLKLPADTQTPRGLFTMDPTRHTEVRAWMNVAFQTSMADAERMTREATEAALTDILDMPALSFDFVQHFARRVPRDVFFGVLGIAPQDRESIDALVRTVMMRADHTLDPVQRLTGKKATVKLMLLLGEQLARATVDRRFNGTLLHEMAKITLWPEQKLSVLEAVTTLLQFTLGGYLSTEFLLCTGTRHLLSDDAKNWKAIRKNPALLGNAIEEMRRFDAPLGIIDRYAACDLEFGGVHVLSGQRLMGLIGSANHDTHVFGKDAERFDILRPKPKDGHAHLTLGGGIHTCIGLPLQATVVPLAFDALLQEMPDLHLASHAQPPWLSDPYFRSFARLMVTR